MAKTTFSNSSIITPTFLNTIYQAQNDTGLWGLRPDGTGTGPFADGHISQIRSNTEINFQSISLSCSFKGVDFAGGSDIPVFMTLTKIGTQVFCNVNSSAISTSSTSHMTLDLTNIYNASTTYLPANGTQIPCIFYTNYDGNSSSGPFTAMGSLSVTNTSSTPFATCLMQPINKYNWATDASSLTGYPVTCFWDGFFTAAGNKGIANQTLIWQTAS